MLGDLKRTLRELLKEAQELKETREDIATTSKFNFFKRQRMKFHVSGGVADLNKRTYDFENKLWRYRECMALNQKSVLIPYIKLLFSIITFVLNIFLVIDM
jgi:hypothetical protein